tara:strand:- start:72 stop:1334 length:1263 start_codon:yes stop_codon:yes gene_type:complete
MQPRNVLLNGASIPTLITAGKRKKQVGRPAVQSSSSTQTSRSIFGGSPHRSIVDAPALIRSNAVRGRSALDIARSVLNAASVTRPTEMHIYFDLEDRVMYPPQRDIVQAIRYPGAPPPALTAEFCKLMNCQTIHDLYLADIYHLPTLKNASIDWVSAFSSTELKPFAWRVFAAALRASAIERAGTTQSPQFKIFCADGKTTHCVSNTGIASTLLKKLEPDFGEADLRVFYDAAMANMDGRKTIIHSIDTDFLLMTIASAWFVPREPFYIALKHSAFDGCKVLKLIGAGDTVRRLNAAFWCMAAGTDYSNPLTNNGYYTKCLVQLMADPPQGPFVLSAKAAVFKPTLVKPILARIKCRKMKKTPLKTLSDTVSDMLFCVKYYGLHWAWTGTTPYPKHVHLSNATKDDVTVFPTAPLFQHMP